MFSQNCHQLAESAFFPVKQLGINSLGILVMSKMILFPILGVIDWLIKLYVHLLLLEPVPEGISVLIFMVTCVQHVGNTAYTLIGLKRERNIHKLVRKCKSTLKH